MADPATSRSDWFATTLTQRRRLYLAGACGCAVAAAIVLWLTWWVLLFVVGFLTTTFGAPWSWIVPVTWVVFALLFVAHATANRQRLEHLEFESVGRLRMTRAVAFAFDSPFLTLAGPKTAHSFVKVISVTLLAGPGLLACAWSLLRRVRTAAHADAARVAQCLERLAESDRKVTLEELEDGAAAEQFPATLAAVLLFDGVLQRTNPPPGLSLTDDLREAVLRCQALRKPRKPRTQTQF